MDQLEVWRVQGRIATAVGNVREAVSRMLHESKELDDALAEAEQLGIYGETSAPTGTGVVR